MRTKLPFFFLLGWVIVGAAIFAEFIGLDNDPGWGRGRFVLLLVGLLICALGISQYIFIESYTVLFRAIRERLSQWFRDAWQWTRRYGFTFPFAIFVIAVYTWFATSGSWTHWDSATRYYADLANGFERGQLHLLAKPSSELLSLPNPYDPELRKGIGFPIDYILYDGRFYIYWGPVPALILVLINPFTSIRIGDLFLAFGFIVGIFALQYVLLLMLWDRFFSSSPKWLLILGIIAAGLSGPWMYMLVNEPNGRIYEAAIAGAQFFLLGGLLLTIRAFLRSNLTYFSLIVTGLLWGLAVGTRLVIAVPISVACLILLHYSYAHRKTIHNLVYKLVALGLPLAFCLVCIGWYNWARFGSITDTGFAYSLAHQDMLKHRDALFSPMYMVQNFYNYVLNVPVALPGFPFLRAAGKTENVLPFFDPLPAVYNAQPITGLLFAVPIVGFLIAPFFQKRPQERDRSQHIHYICAALVGTSTAAFIFLLIFFWAAFRYMGDFLPELVLASTLAFWRGYRFLDPRPALQRLYSIAGVVLAVMGIFTSLLIALSADQYSVRGLWDLV